MQYRVADMILEFHGDPPLEESSLWAPFRLDSEEQADYRIYRYYCEELPSDPRGHCFYDGVKERNYAHSLEEGNSLAIHALTDSLPWATKISQIYEEMALPHVFLKKGRIILHASYIEHNGKGILFTAPSGTGKSTQADLWQLHRGARILNGDRAVIGLRDKIPYAFGFPMSGSSPYCENRDLPLCCIVSLLQGPENMIRRLKGKDALRVIMNGTYFDPKHPDDFVRNMDTAAELLSTPIFELSCRPDVGAVEALEEAIQSFSSPIT